MLFGDINNFLRVDFTITIFRANDSIKFVAYFKAVKFFLEFRQ